MVYFVESLFAILQSPQFLFGVEICSGIAKLCLLIMLLLRALRSSNIPRPLYLLFIILISALVVDITWIIKLSREIFFPAMDYRYVLFIIRISWAFNLLLFQFLGLFIESLGEKNYAIKMHQKVLLGINSIVITYFIFISFFYFDVVTRAARPWFEFMMMNFVAMFMLQISLLPSLYLTIQRIRSRDFPKILKQQLWILVKYLMCPYIISEFIQGFFISSKSHSYAATSISTPLLTFALFYCMRKIIGLRFLNFQSHVQATNAFNFIDDFKNVLEKLSHVTNTNELGHITQLFFKEAFHIVPSRTILYFRKLDTKIMNDDMREPSLIESIVEHFISRHHPEKNKKLEILRQIQILIYDEIAFSNFYDEQYQSREILTFLEQVNADIFLPVYDHQTIVAYIIIERDARAGEFYSNLERDEMVVFASYLGNIINLLQNRNLNVLIQKEKEMREELYSKHQEINQYKESIRSFLRDTQQRKIGILFYKNRKFIFGNQAAKELININVNTQEGHPLTKALKQVAHQVEEYKSSQSCFAKDVQGNRIVISGIPNIEQNNVILTVCYPEISDILKQQIDVLRNPSEWDYVLYLETTRSGQLINQLIPGSTGQLLNFKIDLLKMALSKKALLLQMPDEDLMATVEILHHISLRETLHVLKLQTPSRNFDAAIKIFGINPIFGSQSEQPLLEKLNNIGTLFIQNVHFLDIDTQNYLAEFIRYGYYHVFKGDQKVVSNVRVICSTNQNLMSLIQEGKFSKALFHELRQTAISMPSLSSLSDDEVVELAQGFTEQVVKTPDFNTVLELNEREKEKLASTRPMSLHELKIKIQQLLVQKSKKHLIYQETQFDPAYNISDPELVEAARMGKKALKDPAVLAMLWHKFKNQNKIAAFLGVNRSSVNRRCKEYNLE